MAKNIQSATVYAPPHKMSGEQITVQSQTKAIQKSGNPMDEYNISVAGTSKGNTKGENPHGTGTMRGYGAATKGRKISGKQG